MIYIVSKTNLEIRSALTEEMFCYALVNALLIVLIMEEYVPIKIHFLSYC